MLYFVARVGGLVRCTLEFLGHIELGLVFGCMLPVDMICKYVCCYFVLSRGAQYCDKHVCLSVCLSACQSEYFLHNIMACHVCACNLATVPTTPKDTIAH